MSTETEVYEMYMVWKTLQQMCDDRGYLVYKENLKMTLEEWKLKFATGEGKPTRKDLTFVVAHVDDEAKKLFVFFPDAPKVGMEDIKSYFEQMQKFNVMRGIIAVQLNITPIAKQAMGEMAPKFILEQFLETELMVNITQHEYVPQHIPLKQEEKMVLCRQYKLTDDKIPRIQHSDPISRYYGLDKGTVIKIVRRSKTAGRYVTYRIVY